MLLVTNIMADPDIYWYWIYTANNGGIYVNWIYVMVLQYCNIGYTLPWGDICMSVGFCLLSLRNIHSVMYMHWYWIYNPIYASWIYVLVIDIYCQQLGDICSLEVVCAPFWRGVGECTL